MKWAGWAGDGIGTSSGAGRPGDRRVGDEGQVSPVRHVRGAAAASGRDGVILGAVLAGGRSRRFGSDKAQALLDGRSLLENARAAIAPHVDAVVVCGGPDGLPDRPVSGLGPLGGLNAALHHALAIGASGVLTTGCDTPVFPEAAARALIGDGPAVLEGHRLLGYWPVGLADDLDAHLAESDDRSIRAWMARVGARVAPFAGAPLPNINTPADLAALR